VDTHVRTDRLKTAMALKRVEAKQLAEAVGVSVHTVQSIMCGRRIPTVEVLLKICRELGIEDVDSVLVK